VNGTVGTRDVGAAGRGEIIGGVGVKKLAKGAEISLVVCQCRTIIVAATTVILSNRFSFVNVHNLLLKLN
jgi:hypothetical protein